MKKYIVPILLIIGMVGWQLHAYTADDYVRGRTFFGSGNKLLDPMYLHMQDVADGGSQRGTGQVFYVDSNVANEGDGTSWTRAKDTIDEAVNLCTASRGDIIYVAQGHSETFVTQSLDVDVIGITIIGIGHGSLRPTIVYNHADAEVAIGADNCRIMNMRFITSIQLVLMGIEVEDGVDYFEISGCEFTSAGDNVGTDEFLEAINFVNDNTGCTIRNCYFNAEAAGAEHAIFCDAGTSRLSIVGCDIRGDYSVACIGGDTTPITDVLIQGNILINGSLVADTGINEVAAIVLLDSSAGFIVDNRIVSDVATGLLMRVADDLCFMNNYILDTDGDEFTGTTEDNSATIAAHADG